MFSRQDSSSERSQCTMFLWNNKENYPCYAFLSGALEANAIVTLTLLNGIIVIICIFYGIY